MSEQLQVDAGAQQPSAVASSDVLCCPFCGGNQVGTLNTGVEKARVLLLCLTRGDCTASVWGRTLEEAIQRWNRRPAQPERIECEAGDG